ncbi:MAG: hypothetical protein IJE01_01505 [Clostridia bacterium]|nr:hypothetical protein [Clostridia bacterium]
MSLKTINFEVKKDGVFPKTVQPAGSQGDHQVTNVVFKLDEGLITGINNLPGDTVFRVQTTDGAGGFHSSEFLTFNGEARTITFPIEEDISIPGGIAVLHLVISKIVDQESTDKFFSFPARIKFAGESLGTGSEEQYCKDIDSALLGAKKAEETAKVLADDIGHIATSVKNVLGDGNTYIFNGGKPSSTAAFKTDVVVDSELDLYSQNPLQNKIIAEKIGKIENSLKKLTNGIYIEEFGAEWGWSYEKYSNGLLKCYKNIPVKAIFTGTTHVWGSLYFAEMENEELYKLELQFPFKFTQTPNCIVSESSKVNDLFIVTNTSGGALTTTSAQAVTLARPVDTPCTVETTLHYQAVGFWK